jgi:Tripartite tricarboxylate transporter family receptor
VDKVHKPGGFIEVSINARIQLFVATFGPLSSAGGACLSAYLGLAIWDPTEREREIFGPDTIAVLAAALEDALGQLRLVVTHRSKQHLDNPANRRPFCLPGFDVTTWYGFFAPRGTPAPIINKLNRTINEILADPVVQARLTKAGVVVKGSTPKEFGNHMAAEFARWNAVREASGIPQQ